MEYYIDASYKSINKFGEELCGDKVESIKTEDGCLLVLSDGLGSGVKANILATLTSKIAITMLKGGSTIDETLETIMNTLPECKVRKLAYSTFTIIKLNNNGDCYMVEYENPPTFFYRDGCDVFIDRKERVIKDKTIFESRFKFYPDDLLTVVSDGAVHAGVGEYLNLGWQWENINDFLRDISQKKYATDITNSLLDVCKTLYNDKPGDDTTVLSIKFQPVKYLNLFTGPPKNIEDDEEFIKRVEESRGVIVLSGGTTANIISKAWDEEVKIDLDGYENNLPPVGYMRGVDLVTEGLLTLNKTVEYIREYIYEGREIASDDGAGILGRLLLFDASHIKIVAGTAVNAAHQNPDFPIDFNIKLKVVVELEAILKEFGKSVTLEYV
ncbi:MULTISPECIES: SpoIIE family protein phosphatase [Psychrilyobacter]|uniref:Serine/threonine-protein phosphatase n=1 Tax=Psychrilyobacter piezotolerans TaxID=2293438 RepID=A0ABX9KKK9_9FUSO|nr:MULTISPECIES: SpoIIE family protein phosphatase [Psychrilyobacter]MCS5421031.1 serine/threonine-protein phosphatase [Psychrilyobacter sp. S5]NDI76310.1 SpoIIE family protein phosphatase [Psychrilyobacter piezotolerans]RDE65909.1 serine/threonine-protein phosphatase [Psychrilyobacter sp. S5]REI43087.1 serine/threonine-protein phosphatase [Psychrilyobacter piezotolerans]